jgi:hypothetical protein
MFLEYSIRRCEAACWCLSLRLLPHYHRDDNMDRASQVLAQGMPPGVPTSYRALADHHGNVSHSTLHHRALHWVRREQRECSLESVQSFRARLLPDPGLRSPLCVAASANVDDLEPSLHISNWGHLVSSHVMDNIFSPPVSLDSTVGECIGQTHKILKEEEATGRYSMKMIGL